MVSGHYVREVFLNNDFDFLKGTGKVKDTSFSFHDMKDLYDF